MPSIYHEAAFGVLKKLAAEKIEPAQFRDRLNELYPSWKFDAVPVQGYSDASHHESLIVARSMHDALPVPFGSAPYNWEKAHGFTIVLAYVERPETIVDDIAKLCVAAADRCERVMND